MFLNYIITAWRNLLKNRIISVVNILGLTLGLASAAIAIVYALHELSYESSHKKAGQICRIYLNGDFGEIKWLPSSFGPEGESLEAMFPEIKAHTLSRSLSTTVRAGENIFIEDNILFSDSMIYQMFTIPFVSGNPSEDPQSVVLSEKTAGRYFGRANPIGKSVRINYNGTFVDFQVTGIFKDFPDNTHLKADFIIPLSFSARFGLWKYNEYNSAAYNSYVLLKPGTDIKILNAKILASFKIPLDVKNISAFLMPIRDIHFKGTFENNKGKLLVFLFGGLFVLFISFMNYINLTNILFSVRTRETGVRKVIGARRIHIFMQFMTDTVVSALIGFNLAIILLKIALPWFNARMYTNIHLTGDRTMISGCIALFLATLVFSGIYPAIRYSGKKPVSLIKPGETSGLGKGFSRRILTTFQLTLGVIFIQVLMVMDKENRYISNADVTRYSAENVICLNGYPWGDLGKVKDELLKNPDIEAVSWGSTIPTMGYNVTMDWKEEHNTTMVAAYQFEPDYLDVFRIKMLNGRFLSNQYQSDKESAIVINQKTADVLGYKDPLQKKVLLYGKYYTIIGVVDDYMANPPIMDKSPLLITYSKNLNDYLVIRIKPEGRESTHQYIIKTLKKLNPDYPINIRYHQDVIFSSNEAKSYVAASRMMHIFFLLIIITSLIGIFGLSVFLSQRNRKETGIRRAFGAPISGIMLKLSRSLILQALIAIGIATPISFVFSRGYLSVFPLHPHIGIQLFMLGGLFSLVMLILTVSWQTWKAATRDPVHSLRYE